MNIYIISQKYENKHLQFFHYKFIINSLNQSMPNIKILRITLANSIH